MIVVVGYASVDRSRLLDRLPQAGVTARVVTDLDATSTYRAGGIAHTAIALASTGSEPVVPICGVGDDIPGHAFVQALADAGCCTTGVEAAGQRSPTSELFHDPDNRTACVFDPGSGWADLSHSQKELVAEADVVVSMIGPPGVTTTTLQTSPSTADLAWVVKIDPSSQSPEQASEVACRARIAFCNVTERPAAEAAAEGHPLDLVCTDGPHPVTVITDGSARTHSIEPVVGTVNPTGGGDAFAGGYLAAWREGRDQAACVAAGATAARRRLEVE